MTDLQIARSIEMEPITKIAEKLGIDPKDLELYGNYKAKLPLKYINPDKFGKLVLVSAMSPTPAGEGKTTMSIGLSQALNRIGKKSTVVLREPSLGPVFGVKGGAAGGGYSQVVPMEDINLHFTGDFSAVEKAHNLLSAMIDNNLQRKNRSLNLDPKTIVWKRVMDMNDRSLRNVVIGLGERGDGVTRQSGFDITVASEVMAILCISQGLDDLKKRLGNIFIGFTYDREPIYARDLNAHGAMAALLKDAVKPNLVQTLEHTPAIIHGGPFANIAQGTNTILATKTSMSLTDYTITEAGFGFDLGGEKFLDIKCRAAGLKPNAVVVVATIRALKYHGGKAFNELSESDIDALKIGVVNLEKHIENVRKFNIKPIVAINQFISDSEEEIAFIKEFCKKLNVPVSLADVWAKGGEGAEDLARMVIKASEKESNFKPLYDLNESVESKIEKIATEIYGADGVDYSAKALNDLQNIKALGLEDLAVCVAKTQMSLSDDPKVLGRPRNYRITVREIEIAAGAGFLIPITGEIMRMPGLPLVPAAESIDVDSEGNISGLF